MPQDSTTKDSPSLSDQKADEEVVTEYIPGVDDDIIRQTVLPALIKADETFRSRKDRYSRLENLYFGNIAEDSPAKELATQFSSGMAFQLIETLMPILIAGKFRPRVSSFKGEEDDNAKNNELLLNDQITADNLEQPLEDWIRQAGKTLGVLRVDRKVVPLKSFIKQRKYKFTIPFVNKTVGVGPMETVPVVTERFYHILETIPFEDVIVPECRDNDSAPFIGMRHSKKIREMEADKRYKNLNVLKEFVASDMVAKGTMPDEYKIDREGQKGVNMDAAMPLIIEAEIELVDAYFRYEGKMYLAAVTKEGHQIVRSECIENWHDMYPIRILSLNPVENSLIGLSVLEVVEDDINELDTWTNIVAVTGLFDIQRPVIYDKDKVSINFQKNPIKYAPGALYASKGLDSGFKLMETPKVEQSHILIVTAIIQRIKDRTGINEYISGTEAITPNTPLGAVQLKTAQAKKRFAPTIKHIRRELTDVFFMMMSNNQQYLPDNYEVRILGKNGTKIKRLTQDSIQGRFDVDVQGFEDVTADESERVAKHQLMVKDGFEINQKAGAPLVNIPFLVRKLYEDGYSVRDIEQVMVNLQETVQNQDQGKVAQAQAANQENLDPVHAIVRPDDDHATHLDVHTMFLKSPAFQQLSPAQQNALAIHINAHRAAMGGGAGGPMAGPGGPPGAPMAPGGPAAPTQGNIAQNAPPADLTPNYQQP